jgi:UDP-glucose 4-epimerase
VGPRRPQRSVAITGLGSFVGGRIAARLLDAPNPPHVVGVDLVLPRRLEGRIAFHRVDLTEPTADSQTAEILGKERCEALLHAAFFESPHASVEYAHELEVIGSLHAMNAAAAAGVGKLVVASTAQVYGAHPDNPNYLSEDAPLRGHPDAHAVRDRVEMERLLALFAARHPALVVTSLRPCSIAGPSSASPLLRHLEADRVTTLLGYDPLLQFLHEEDWLDAVEAALERDARGAFNLAGGGVLPLSTLLRIAGKRSLPLPHPLLYRFEYLSSLSRSGDAPAGFYDYLRFLWVVDTERARRELGFEPAYTTQEAWMSFVVSRRLRRYR